MLILSEEDVKAVLTMDTCVEAIEAAYRLYAMGEAVQVPRNELEIFSEGDYSKGIPALQEGTTKDYPMVRHAAQGLPGPYFFSLKTMSGAVPKGGPFPFGCGALRLNVDILSNTRSIDGTLRRQQIPAAPGGRFCGQVHLWRTDNAEPICMMPDSYIEAMRVGATNAIAAKYLARADASTYGLIGSGLQAETQLLGISQVRSLKQVKVWSPTKDHREAFARKWSQTLSLDVTAVSSFDEALENSDMVGAATNSMEPVFRDKSVIRRGAFITVANTFNMSKEFFEACDIRVVHNNRTAWPADRTKLVFTPQEARRFISYWVTESVAKEDPLLKLFQDSWLNKIETERIAWLGDVIVGRVRRTSPGQTAAFINNVGIGLQFAAVGVKVFEKAVAEGVGRQVPTEWFTEEIQG